MTVSFDDITACIPTRGNKPMDEILTTLPYKNVIVWDNSKERVDLKVYGRYAAAREATTKYIYFQDDDVLFTEHQALLDFYNSIKTPRGHVANNGHGPNTGGYDDLAISPAGAIVHKGEIYFAFRDYFRIYPRVDDVFLYYCDYIFGILVGSFHQIDLPYTRLYEDEDYHLCRQPWAEELKAEAARRARMIRDHG